MADWKIINGNLPFKDDFPTRPTSFDDFPDWIWHKVEDELPYKVMFPTRYAIDEAPQALWMKYPGELPFKIVFPKMLPPPVMEKLYEGEREIVLLSDYHQTVILSGYNQKIVIDDIEL